MARTKSKGEEASTWGVSPQVRGALREFVLEARRALEDDFRRQLTALGVRPEADVAAVPADPVAAAAHAVIARLRESGTSPEEAFDTFVRDSAFTFLNRLVGLRCLEERGMLRVDGERETALARDPRLGASSLYFRARNELPPDADPREVWRATLDRAFRAISEDVGELFDPASEYGRLFPLANTLRDLVDRFNDPAIPGEAWADDEVLGWVYQYYNSEEKDAAYEKLGKGGKLERPDELAAATCLYTERYMVDYLLQNTLGALWAEMHPGSRLPERWSYFVRPPEGAPRRQEAKRPERLRDLTLLDPACGSGHFLARAFDLLVEMYREEGLEAEEEIPHLILERNLYGIDIDLRAVQLSALRLYLKACELAGPGFRPRRLNLVATDVALPGAPPPDLLERFRGDPQVQALIRGVWSELREAPRLGSLLHPERRVRDALERRRGKGPTLEFPDEEAWERFAVELVEQIRVGFEEEAAAEDIGRRLFGRDLEKGMSLVEALTRRYDAVVTNPPYAGSKNLDPDVKAFIEREYRDGKRDLYAAFILRCLEFARPGGHVGMVTQQSWLFLRSFAKLRGHVLNGTAVTTLAHLGPRGFEEIGGEVVTVALFTLRAQGPPPEHRMTAFRLVGPKSPAEKNRLLRRAIAGKAPGIVSTPQQSDLLAIPETPFVYWLRPRFFELLRSERRLSDVAEVRQGLATADNERFVRCFWEVPELGVVENGKPVRGRWFWYAKGGRYQKWAGLEWLVVDWANDGKEIRSFVGPDGRLASRPQNIEYYFRPGLTYTLMARGSMGVRFMDRSAFDVAGISIFARAAIRRRLAAVLNARASSFLLRVTTQDLKFHAGYAGNLPWTESAVDPQVDAVGEHCGRLKAMLVCSDPTERTFDPGAFVGVDEYRSEATVVAKRPGAWPEDTDVLVVPGIPGKFTHLDTGEAAYPSETSDIVKLLQENGLSVRYAEPRGARVGFKGADWWVPILIFAREALANGAGEILATVLRERIGLPRLPRTKLHVRLGRRDADGSVRWFEASGAAQDVLTAMTGFLGDGDA